MLFVELVDFEIQAVDYALILAGFLVEFMLNFLGVIVESFLESEEQSIKSEYDDVPEFLLCFDVISAPCVLLLLTLLS